MGIHRSPQTLRYFAAGLALVLAACARPAGVSHDNGMHLTGPPTGPRPVTGANLVCGYHDAQQSHREVTVSGTVVRILGTRIGPSGTHEGFLLKFETDCGLTVRVETNTDITGPMPISVGEHVTLKGEYEYYPIGGVIHWTHHDPRFRHEAGYVEADGKIYQ